MRTPALVVAAGAVIFGLAACNDKIDSSAEARSSRTSPELVPFESGAFETDPADAEDPGNDLTAATEAPTKTTKASSKATEPTVRTVDPMPGDTAVFDTRPDSDPLCRAAKDVLAADAKYQKVLDDAIAAAGTESGDLSKALRKLPITQIRNAYDDLSAEMPQNLRRQVATIRDFTIDHGRLLMEVQDLEQLSQLIADIESDPNAPGVSKARKNVSQYTEAQCGIKIASGR